MFTSNKDYQYQIYDQCCCAFETTYLEFLALLLLSSSCASSSSWWWRVTYSCSVQGRLSPTIHCVVSQLLFSSLGYLWQFLRTIWFNIIIKNVNNCTHTVFEFKTTVKNTKIKSRSVNKILQKVRTHVFTFTASQTHATHNCTLK